MHKEHHARQKLTKRLGEKSEQKCGIFGWFLHVKKAQKHGFSEDVRIGVQELNAKMRCDSLRDALRCIEDLSKRFRDWCGT